MGYLNNNASIDRLIGEYKKHGNLIIGFDFDNTVCNTDNLWVSDTAQIIDLLRECKELGFTLCLYTISTSEEWLKWKVKYCEYFGITPDYVNNSPVLNEDRKPFFNILLDDRAGLVSSVVILGEVIKCIKEDDNRGKRL